jgi:hypothetical protein
VVRSNKFFSPLLIMAEPYTGGIHFKMAAGNAKGGSITVRLTSCLTGLESDDSMTTTDNFLFLFAKQTNPNQSNRRSTVQ